MSQQTVHSSKRHIYSQWKTMVYNQWN